MLGQDAAVAMAFCARALPPLPPLPARLQVPGCSCSPVSRRWFWSFRLVDPTAEEQGGSVEPRRVETGDRGGRWRKKWLCLQTRYGSDSVLCSWWGPARPCAGYQVKLVFLISKVQGGLRPWKTAQKLAFGLAVDVHFSSQRRNLVFFFPHSGPRWGSRLTAYACALSSPSWFYRRSRLNSRSFRSWTNILTLLGTPFLQQNSFLWSRKGDSGSRSL